MNRKNSPKKAIISSNGGVAKEDSADASIMASRVSFSSFSAGPLPVSSEFAGYEQTLPGAAERILAMAEKEQSHRHEIELKAVDLHSREQEIESSRVNMSINAGKAEVKLTGRGQASFLILLLVLILSCLTCVILDKKTFAYLFFAVFIGVYLYSSGIIGKDKKSETKTK